MLESILVMREKIATIKAAAESLMRGEDEPAPEAAADGDVEMVEA